MKKSKLTPFSALFLPFFFMGATRGELKFVPSETGPSQIRVDGTSNVRDWDVATRDVRGHLILAAENVWTETGMDAARLPRSPEQGLSFVVEIPAASVLSDNRRFNNNLHGYMDVENHETIRFEFVSLELAKDGAETPAAGELPTQVTGNLTLAGATESITFPVTWTRREQKLLLSGEAAFKMSLFGITPPRMMMGSMRTGDEVKVRFTWVLEPSAPEEGQP